MTNRCSKLALSLVLMGGLPLGGPLAAAGGAGATEVAGIGVYFRLDPRLTKGLHMGDRWVSPATYHSTLQQGGQATVMAMAKALDPMGRPIRGIRAEWTPEDPDMLTVSEGPGEAVTITAHRVGRTRLRLAYQGASAELSVEAMMRGDAFKVELTQEKKRVTQSASAVKVLFQDAAEGWASPPVRHSSPEGTLTLRAAALCFDTRRRSMDIGPEWVAADPTLVTVSPNRGKSVEITVHRAGQSILRVGCRDFARELFVEAERHGTSISVELSDPGSVADARP